MKYWAIPAVLLAFSCSDAVEKTAKNEVVQIDTMVIYIDTAIENRPVEPKPNSNDSTIIVNTTPAELLAFARSLEGIPYVYASADPGTGFDCSGFITYVFNHFNITVPRASADFTNMKPEISLREAKPGDLVLFTGTDTSDKTIGHMGIINEAKGGEVSFIHATSGKANAVTVTPLNPHYLGRFGKIIRVLYQPSKTMR